MPRSSCASWWAAMCAHDRERVVRCLPYAGGLQDVDCSGGVNYEEFVAGIRPVVLPLEWCVLWRPERAPHAQRPAGVLEDGDLLTSSKLHTAFDVLDRDHDGMVDLGAPRAAGVCTACGTARLTSQSAQTSSRRPWRKLACSWTPVRCSGRSSPRTRCAWSCWAAQHRLYPLQLSLAAWLWLHGPAPVLLAY